jgi:Ecdysteroid kinase-like family
MAAGLRSTGRALGQAALALSPWVRARRPYRAEDITAEWLTSAVGARVDGAVALRVEPLDGTTGTTDRRRLRIAWNDAGVAGGLPETVFVKSTPRSAQNRAMVGALDMAVDEVRFYRQAASVMGEHAPAAFAAYAGPGARFLLVLEDLVTRGCRPFALADDCGLEHARSMMDTLARLHASFWDSSRFDSDLRWARPWTQRPGYALLYRMYRWGRKGAVDAGGDEVTPAVRRLSAALNRHDRMMGAHFERGPLTLLHGDSHLGNTYALPTGGAGLLDWQVVFRGPGLREVAYFVVSALEPEVRRTHEQELLTRYRERLRERGVEAPGEADAWRDYRLFAAEIWDASAMTVRWPGLQAPENVAATWRRTCAAAADLDVAGALEQAAASSVR